MLRLCLLICLLLSFMIPVFSAEKRIMTVKDMWAMKRISDVQLSPDGKCIAFTQTEYCMEDNSSQTDIWMISIKGGIPQRMTTHDAYDGHPRWRPDGSAITFISTRNDSRQIYSLPIDGGEAVQISDFPVDVLRFIWSPTGDKLAFTSYVYPDAHSLNETAQRDEQKEESHVKARIVDHLLFRIWDRWTNGKRTHVFVYDLNDKSTTDVTPGDYDAPPLDLNSDQDFVFSPDGKELAYVSNKTDMPTINTNNDIYLVPLSGGDTVNLTGENQAVDNAPRYSPDGNFIAYKAMVRPGFEADQYDIILYNRQTGLRASLTTDFDLSPLELKWSSDSQCLYFNTQERGRRTVYRVDIQKNAIEKLMENHVNADINIGPASRMLYVRRQSNVMPYEILSLHTKKSNVTQITHVNKPLLDQLEMNPVEDFWFESFDGQEVHGMLVKPPFFDETKKYPLIYLIHGGPQGMWSDDFHYRWNSSMFAAPGYVVVMVNFRGSKGYGQDWCDAVSKDWGGGPYRDLMTGLDYVLQEYDFIDDSRIAAAGASYGGFMVNWIATHTDRFDALVSHAGVYDQRSMYGATEELWFPEWEFGGTSYENPELYEKWSPSYYVDNFNKYKTPTLVIHGQHDYRVPVTQGFQMFTALQRMGVPSKMIYFPDETHFVSKPQNARLWWVEVFDWIEKWINK